MSSKDETLNNSVDGAILATGGGNDSIYNSGSYVSISAGDGNDLIYISYSRTLKNTIVAGKGDDTITLNYRTAGNHLIKYAKGDGNDLIKNYREDDTISIGGAQYKTATINSDVIIQVIGSGHITLSGAARTKLNILGESVTQNTTADISLNGTSGDDYFENRGNNVTISGGNGNDSIINYGNNPTVKGTSYGKNAKISGGAGNDSIVNSGANAEINGDNGDDTISNSNYGVNSTINGGQGNDSILNNATAEIHGGFGKDTLTNSNLGEGASLFGDEGDDSIYSSNARNVLLDGGNGNDTITASGNVKGVTVRGGNGNDKLYGHTGNTNGIIFEYNLGDGNDTIYNYTAADTIVFDDKIIYTRETVGANFVFNINDKNTIVIEGAANKIINVKGGHEDSYKINITNNIRNTLLTGSDENDTIKNNAISVTIDALAGEDFISNSATNVSIHAGDGNDTISLIGTGGNMTIKGGGGADLIQNVSSIHSGRLYQHSSREGNDTIINANLHDTLQITTGDFEVSRSGGNFIVSAGGEIITFQNSKYVNVISPVKTYTAPNPTSKNDSITNSFDYENLDLLAGNDYAYNTGNFVTINGGRGNDTIEDYFGEKLSIVGGEGKDSLYFNHSQTLTVDGGAGDDTIYGNYFNFASVNGGAGNDFIRFNGNRNTILGGAGNDTISIGGDASYTQYNYTNGDGNDIIYGLKENDSLQINGKITQTSIKGDDVILKVGAGAITLVGMDEQPFYLNKVSTIFGGNTLPAGMTISGETLLASSEFTGNEIKLANFDDSLTAVNAAGVKQNLNLVGNAKNNYLRCGNGNDTIFGGAGKNTLYGGNGNDIFIYSKNELYIEDYRAGEDKIKIENATIQGSSVSGNDVVLNLKGGENLTVANGKNKNITVIDSSGKESSLVYGRYSYNPARTAIILNSDFYGALEAGDYDSKVKSISAANVTTSAEIYGNAGANIISGGAANLTIYGGAGNDCIFGGSGNENIFGDAGNDTLSGGTGRNTLTGGAGKDIFVFGGGFDTVTDFSKADDKISLRSGAVTDAYLNGADMIFRIGAGGLTLRNTANTEITIGKNIYYNNLTYDAKKSSASLSSTFTGTLSAADYSANVKDINASKVENSLAIYGNAKANIITCGSGNDSIFGNAGNDKLYGGTGADTLSGGAGNDTLYGGDGKDIFVYSAGNDVIADFTKDDTIILESGTITSAALKGSDVVFKIGKNTLNVKNGKDKDIKIGDRIYYNDWTYNLDKSSVTLASTFKDSLAATSYLKEIDASAVVKKILIEGNSSDNTISGGTGADTLSGGAGNDLIFGNAGNDYLSGGDGNDSLYGGAGNDTLSGGAGADIFYYTAGKDVIVDYTANQDKIVLAEKISKVSYKGGDAIFTIGKGTLTVKEGDGKIITFVDAQGNTDRQRYSSAKTFDLFEDNNFITDTPQLSEITAQKFSVTEIQTSNAENFAQDSTLLTFHKDK